MTHTLAEESTSDDASPIEGRATRGALWVVFGYGGAQVVRLVSNLILTRLLFAEAFGIMALMSTVLQGLELFSDFGIGPSLIQNERQDARFVDTAWTMQVLRGLAIWAFASALAVPCATFYGEPSLVWLLPLVSSTALFAGFQSTRVFTLNRTLDIRRVEISLVSAQLVGLVTMVGWALVDRSVYALVAGALATSLARTILGHVYLPGERNRFAWDREAASELLRFGRWIFVSTLLTFLAGQTDRLVFARLVPLDRLGVYYIGIVIASLPSEALSKLSTQILFPVYSSIRLRDGDFRDVFDRLRAPLNAIAAWAFSGLVAGGPTAVDLLYDDRYRDAGWAVQMLAASGMVLVLGNTYGAALFAADRTRAAALSSFAKVVALAVFIPLGYQLGERVRPGLGFPCAVLGFAASELARYAVCAFACRSIGIVGVASDVRTVLRMAVVGGLGALVESSMRTHEVPVFVRALVIAVVVSLAHAPFLAPFVRERLAARRAAASAA